MPVVPDQLRRLVETHPDETAYRVVGRGSLTFREWDASASRVARGLGGLGVGVGDRVATVLEPGDALFQLPMHVGVHKAGAVNVPINTRLAPGEMASMLNHARPRVVVVSAERQDVLQKIIADVPSVEHAVTTDDVSGDAVAWAAFLADDDSDVQADIDEDDPADIVYTSGTTGRPKGVLTRHRNALQLAVNQPHWNGMGWYHASPLATTAGLAFLFVPMQLGMTGVYQPRFDASTFLDLVETGAVSMAFLVPAMIEILLHEDDLSERDLSGLHMVTVGSAPIAPATLLEFDDLLPNGSVLNSFALTESGSAQVVLPASEVRERPGSVGRPIPPTEARVVDEGGRPVPTGTIGEIVLRNPGKNREYYRDPEATRTTWKDGWLHTGDLGRIDEDGFLYIAGRKKDVIIRGGHNVYATDVESVLYAHPDVREAAVVGVPHDVLGEDVAAVVVPREGVDVDVGDLIDWCRDRLADYKTPRHIAIRDALPRNPTGKVLKDELRGIAFGGQEPK